MGRRRRERETAKKPLTREQLDRYTVPDPKTWKELPRVKSQYH